MEIPQKRMKGGQKMICKWNIIPGKSRKRIENFLCRQMAGAGGKLKFYNINYKVSNLNGCLGELNKAA